MKKKMSADSKERKITHPMCVVNSCHGNVARLYSALRGY